MGHRGPYGSRSSAGTRYRCLFQSKQWGDACPWPPPPPAALPISFPAQGLGHPTGFSWAFPHGIQTTSPPILMMRHFWKAIKFHRAQSHLKHPNPLHSLAMWFWTLLLVWSHSGPGTYLKMFVFTPGVRWDKTGSERGPSAITAAPDQLCLPGLRLCGSSRPSKPQHSWTSKPQEMQEQFWWAQPVALQGWLGFNYVPGGFLVGGWSN